MTTRTPDVLTVAHPVGRFGNATARDVVSFRIASGDVWAARAQRGEQDSGDLDDHGPAR